MWCCLLLFCWFLLWSACRGLSQPSYAKTTNALTHKVWLCRNTNGGKGLRILCGLYRLHLKITKSNVSGKRPDLSVSITLSLCLRKTTELCLEPSEQPTQGAFLPIIGTFEPVNHLYRMILGRQLTRFETQPKWSPSVIQIDVQSFVYGFIWHLDMCCRWISFTTSADLHRSYCCIRYVLILTV